MLEVSDENCWLVVCSSSSAFVSHMEGKFHHLARNQMRKNSRVVNANHCVDVERRDVSALLLLFLSWSRLTSVPTMTRLVVSSPDSMEIAIQPASPPPPLHVPDKEDVALSPESILTWNQEERSSSISSNTTTCRLYLKNTGNHL